MHFWKLKFMLLIMYLVSCIVALNFNKTLNKHYEKIYFFRKAFTNQFIYYLLGFIVFSCFVICSQNASTIYKTNLLDKYWSLYSSLSLSLESIVNYFFYYCILRYFKMTSRKRLVVGLCVDTKVLEAVFFF